MPRPLRVLVVKTTSMGDVVHTLPAVSDIARLHPGAQIDWLVEAPFAAIAALHPAVRQVLPLSWRKWRKSLRDPATRAAIGQLRQRLQAERYDWVIDFQGLVKSAMWAVQAHGTRAGYGWRSAREPLASLLYHRHATVARDLHAVERSRRLAAAVLGYPMPTTPPDFGLQAPAPAWSVPGMAPHAVLIPCASRPEKLWPEAHWRVLIEQMQARGWTPVVLWGSAEEEQRAQRLAAGTQAVLPPFLSVGDTAAVLAGARVVVGLDTGFTHLAAALARPTVGIYCDHEPGLAGVTGSGWVRSLGGKGRVPSLDDVMAAFAQACEAAAAG